MTGLIDRAGTLKVQSAKPRNYHQVRLTGEINLFGVMQVTLITYTLVLKEMYSTVAMTIIKTIVVVIYTKPLSHNY